MKVSMENLGGANTHAEKSGVSHFVCKMSRGITRHPKTTILSPP